jgi:hypothetical protein
MIFQPATTIDRASIRAAQEAAKTADELDFPFDPFNLRVAVKPIKRKRK